MRSGPTGERQSRHLYLPGDVPSSAQPQPRKFAGTRIEWTSGPTAACLILCRRWCPSVIPSKEPKMKASVKDEGRTPDVPQFDTSGRRTFQKAEVPATANLAGWLVPVGLL